MMKHNEFARAMREVDPSIVLIASGRMLEDDALHADDRKYVGNLQPLYGSPEDWTGTSSRRPGATSTASRNTGTRTPARRFDMSEAPNAGSGCQR